MQRARTDVSSEEPEVKEKLELKIVIPDDESCSGVSSSHSAIETAPDAFKILMQESVLFALSKDYKTKMNIMHAIGDAFCDKGEFSWIKSGKLTGAVAIGAFASIFVVNPSGAAAKTLTDAFKQQTGIDLAYADIIMRLFQITSTGGTAALATFSGLNLIETYLGYASDAEKFLKYKKSTCEEISKLIFKKVFDLLCALASSVPTFFFAESISLPLAILTAAANTAINWLGVSSLPLTPKHIHPARRVELTYLHEQLETFLKLPEQRQKKILADIKALQQQDMTDNDYKIMYTRILNLAKPDAQNPQLADAEIKIQLDAPPSCPKKAFAVALGVYTTATEIAFIEATYIGIARLFQDSTSTPAIASGVSAAAFSVLSNIGFGFFSGYNAANAITSDNIPFAKLYLSKTREAIKATIYIISLFSGGTAFTLAMNADTDLTNLAGITGTLKSCLDLFTGIVSYSTGYLITAYYTLRLCDEILIFFAQRCADEDIRRLFTFTIETRRLFKSLAECTDENYLTLLRWKMTNCKELSSLLHTLFKERLSEAQYNRVRTDVNAERLVMKDYKVVDSYQTTESFLQDTPEWQEEHDGLRQRKGCC